MMSNKSSSALHEAQNFSPEHFSKFITPRRGPVQKKLHFKLHSNSLNSNGGSKTPKTDLRQNRLKKSCSSRELMDQKRKLCSSTHSLSQKTLTKRSKSNANLFRSQTKYNAKPLYPNNDLKILQDKIMNNDIEKTKNPSKTTVKKKATIDPDLEKIDVNNFTEIPDMQSDLLILNNLNNRFSKNNVNLEYLHSQALF